VPRLTSNACVTFRSAIWPPPVKWRRYSGGILPHRAVVVQQPIRFWLVFARMHTLETTPEGEEQGLELFREILPWLCESTGFRGALRLASPDRSKSITITLWADEAAMLASAEAAKGLGALAAEASGSKRLALEDYEVTFFER